MYRYTLVEFIGDESFNLKDSSSIESLKKFAMLLKKNESLLRIWQAGVGNDGKPAHSLGWIYKKEPNKRWERL